MSEQEQEKPPIRRLYLRTVSRYAAMGCFLGVALTAGAWVFQFIRDELPLTLQSIVLIHRNNPLLFLIDLSPGLFALLFGMVGHVHALVEESKAELEDRVNQRTFEITLEKARTNAILDTAADGIVTFDEQGVINGYNNAAERMFGYRPSEALGRMMQMMIPGLQVQPSQLSTEFVRSRSLFSGRPQIREFEGLRKDGTTVPIEVDVSKVTIGEEVSYTAIIRDITDRKRQERLEKSLMQVSTAVNQVESLEDLYPSIHRFLGQVLDVTNFFIGVYNEKTDSFDIPYIADEQHRSPQRFLPAEGTLLGVLLKRREPLLLDREGYEELLVEGKIEALDIPFQSWLGVPLFSLGKPIGVLVVQTYIEGLSYTERDVWIMNFVSGQIANAIDRENARELLRSSEKRYRRMVEEAGDLVYTLDVLGHFTYVNPPTVKLTGYSEEELIGKHYLELVADSHKTFVQKTYRRQLENKTRETTLEFPVVTRHGEERWIEQKATLVVEEERIIGFEAVVHDVTERRQAEEALREREERFRSLSASSPIGIFQLDQRGNCIYVNKRFEEITGRTLDEMQGTNWMNVVHEEERETFRTEWIFARDDSQSAAREVRVQRPDGTVRWVNIRWTATHGDNGAVMGYVGTFEDISKRKASEKISGVLYEISQAAQTTPDLDEFFSSLHCSLDSIIDTTNFYIALYDDETDTLRFPYAVENRGQRITLAERKLGKGLTGYMIRKARPVLLDERSMNELYQSGEAQLIGKPAKNWLGIPLIADGRVEGGVIIQSYTDAGRYTEADVQTMSVVSSQIATAIRRKQAETQAKEYLAQLSQAHSRIKEDLAIAARVQRSRLPKAPPPVDSVEFSWLFDSCEEVAGDMFNFVMLDDHHVGIYILDVSGHGVSAALLSMTLSRALTAANDGSGVLVHHNGRGPRIATPAEVAAIMNERFPMNQETNQYFTMLYGILDLQNLTFEYVRGGHPAPVLVTDGRARELDEVCGPAIGIIPGIRFETSTLQLQGGDSLILFTDGVDETTNPEGTEFGMERITETLTLNGRLNIHDQIANLREAVNDFRGGRSQLDDITLVGFQVRPL